MCAKVNRISSHKRLHLVHEKSCSWMRRYRKMKCWTGSMRNSKSAFQTDPQTQDLLWDPWREICHLSHYNHEYSLFSRFYWTCWRYSWAVLADTYWCSLSLLLAIVFSHFSTLRTNIQVCQSHFALQIICSFITVISKDIWKRWIYERLSCILRRPGISMTL